MMFIFSNRTPYIWPTLSELWCDRKKTASEFVLKKHGVGRLLSYMEENKLVLS